MNKKIEKILDDFFQPHNPHSISDLERDLNKVLEDRTREITDTIQAKLKRNDNPLLTAGLRYALTIINKG